MTVSALVLFTSAFIMTKATMSEFNRLGGFSEGLQTCFYRGTQTYTALLWNAKDSPYRTDNFLKTTEECFSDLIEEARSLAMNAETADFNELSSLAHWFHLGVIDISTPIQNVQNKFEALESKKENLISKLENLSEAKRKDVQDLINLMGLLIVGYFLYAIFSYRRFKTVRSEKSLKKEEIDKRAKAELNHEDFPMSSRIEQVLLDALEESEMYETKDLFYHYHTRILEGKIQVSPAMTESEEKSLPPIPLAIEPFILNSEFEQVLDKVQPELTENNIFYVDDFSADLTLYGEGSDFQKTLSFILNRGMKTIPAKADKKLINITTKKLGSSIVMNVEFLSNQGEFDIASLQRLREETKEGLESHKGQLQSQLNILGLAKSSSCKGLNYQLIFPIPIEAQVSSPKKTTIRKFKKKDFLANQQNPS